MIRTKGNPEKFKGSIPSLSPTVQEPGVFSLCSGGVPRHGALGRLPGKSLIGASATLGGVINIMEFGQKVAVQFFNGLVIYDSSEIFPDVEDYVVDNSGNLVVDNFGIQVIR